MAATSLPEAEKPPSRARPEGPFPSSKRLLEAHERISEVLFGLIMTLTFTGSLSVAQAGRNEIRTMLIGALGCNLAWGIIDGVLYLLGCLAEKGRSLRTLQAVLRATDPQKAQQLITRALPPILAAVIKPEEVQTLHQRLQQLPEPPARAHLHKRDWGGAVGVFLIVFLSTLPLAVPFLFLKSVPLAMRVSNAIAVVMLFVAGFAYGRHIGRSPMAFGLAMVILGILLTGLTILLGG